MHTFKVVVSSLAVLPFNLAASLPRTSEQEQHRPLHLIHQFPAGTWIENLAIRSNGEILATDDTHPRIYQVDLTRTHEAVVVHEFTGTPSILGIVESSPDVFHVCTYATTRQSILPQPKLHKLQLYLMPVHSMV